MPAFFVVRRRPSCCQSHAAYPLRKTPQLVGNIPTGAIGLGGGRHQARPPLAALSCRPYRSSGHCRPEVLSLGQLSPLSRRPPPTRPRRPPQRPSSLSLLPKSPYRPCNSSRVRFYCAFCASRLASALTQVLLHYCPPSRLPARRTIAGHPPSRAGLCLSTHRSRRRPPSAAPGRPSRRFSSRGLNLLARCWIDLALCPAPRKVKTRSNSFSPRSLRPRGFGGYPVLSILSTPSKGRPCLPCPADASSIDLVRQTFPEQADVVEKHWSSAPNAPENRPDEGMERFSHDLHEWEMPPTFDGSIVSFRGALIAGAELSRSKLYRAREGATPTSPLAPPPTTTTSAAYCQASAPTGSGILITPATPWPRSIAWRAGSSGWNFGSRRDWRAIPRTT